MSNMQSAGQAGSVSHALALNTDFLSNQPISMIMKAEYASRNVTFKTLDGNELFRTENEYFSASQRGHLIDCRTNSELFTIRQEGLGFHSRHYAELPPEGSGNTLFESETHPGVLKGAKTILTFTNAANNGRKEQLEFVDHNIAEENEVLYQGQQVARIITESFHVRDEFQLDIPAGIDPLLIIVLAIIKHDRNVRRRRANN